MARLAARELPGDLLPGTFDAATDAAFGVGAHVRRGRVLAAGLLALLGTKEVTGTATADVIDGGSILAETLLLGELLVEGEHGTLLLAVHVAGSTAAASEEGVGWGRRELDAGCWAGGICASSDGLGVHTGCVTGTASSRVVDIGGGDGRVRLGDVVGGHCEESG